MAFRNRLVELINQQCFNLPFLANMHMFHTTSIQDTCQSHTYRQFRVNNSPNLETGAHRGKPQRHRGEQKAKKVTFYLQSVKCSDQRMDTLLNHHAERPTG